jgi:hypothetical protein
MAISRSDMYRQLYNKGGIITLDDAKRMAPQGESLAYINKDEAALLKSLGGAGEDVNGTGIKSYFVKKFFKKAANTVKKVVKSPIGKAAILAGGAGLLGGVGPFAGLRTSSLGKYLMGGKLGAGFAGPTKSGILQNFFLKDPRAGFSLSNLLGKGLTNKGLAAGIGGLSGLAGLAAAGEQEEDEIDISDIDRGEGIDFSDVIRRARLNDPEFRFLPGADYTSSYAEGGEVEAEEQPTKKIMVDKLEVEIMPGESEERAMLDAMMNDIDEIMPEDRKREFYKLLIPQLRKSGEMSDSEYEGLMGELFEEGKAEGGIMDLGGNEMDLRGGGFVPLGAKEKADDVPARLSKNEFVMTADAVRAAGGGSVDKGADKMYSMMKNLESQV